MNTAQNLTHLPFEPASLALGLVVGAAVAGLVLGLKLAKAGRENAALAAKLESERAALGDHFRSLAQEALQSNTQSFLTLAQEKLRAAQKDGEHDLQKRSIAIEQMVKPVEAHLQRMSGMVEQLQATDKTIRDDLQNLHKETSKLTTALRNPAAQGKWGEFVLETILEKANLIKGQHYETQTGLEGGGRPDVIINLHDGFKIAIDSKAPINDFIARLDDDLSAEDIKTIKTGMARAVRGHVKALGARSYQENIAGSDFVILFLPSEAVFSATLSSDPTIVDYASENNVVIASPMLIISLLRVVGLSWRQARMAENAGKVAELGVELHKRLSTFMDHFAGIGKNVNAALNAYNKAVGSFERQVEPQARKFKQYHVIAQNADLPELAPYENAPRQILSAQNNEDYDEDEKTKRSHG
ncbi:MAG: DNA recombination protein RmuC [Micavibrio aeruginosavorus]|uniref:DNA recombination protein RmuC n=1 Tax=Micavibrio aeruginosavorus TaxID=349221 RepID=A0A2W5N9A8_9BACT|nr:MAG: DNA recombination protein RmuC [Micavibrio aeruginosavorus]